MTCIRGKARCNPARTGLGLCPLADAEHAESKRQYAHTFHRRNTICVAGDFFSLPQTHQVAILLHETGHLLCGNNNHTEAAANRAVKKQSGIQIQYVDSRYGERLEWIPSSQVHLGYAAMGIG